MAVEREVAGIWCSEVLSELSDYLDGDLAHDRRAQIMAHLEGCTICERFGGVFTSAIQALRAGGLVPSDEDTGAYDRLRIRLEVAPEGNKPSSG